MKTVSLLFWCLAGLILAVVPAGFGQVRVMCVGDSITEGWTSTEPSYRLPFWDLMQARNRAFRMVGNRVGNYGGLQNGLATSSVINTFPANGWPASAQRHAAISGTYAAEYSQGLLGAALASMGPSNVPDIALVHIGSNDVGQNRSVNATAAAISSIIDQLRGANPSVRVLLAQVIPAGNSVPGSNYPAVSQLNALIPGLVASKNTAASPVVLVDHNTGYSITDFNMPASFEPIDMVTLSPDTIHPNVAGQAEMARRWLDAVEQVELPPAINISSPAHGVTIAPGTAVTVSIGATAVRGVSRIELYANGSLVGSSSTAPAAFTYTVSSTEPVLFSAMVFDGDFQERVSRPVVINPGSGSLAGALAGMRAWYRSDTLLETASGSVRRWRDVSGNDNHLFQRNSPDRPVLSGSRFRDKPGVVFDGSQFLTSFTGMPVDQNFTKVVVFKLDDTTSENNLISSATSPNGGHALWYGSTANAQLYSFGQNANLSLSYAVSSIATAPNQITTLVNTFQRSNRNGRLYHDNVLGASGTAFRANTDASFQVGAFSGFSYLSGEIAEILIYDRVLGAAQRVALQTYIDARYKAAPNQAPVLQALSSQRAHAGETLVVGASAFDPDGQTLNYSLSSGLSGATVDGSGTITWNLPAGLAQGVYTTTLIATDTGAPPLSDSTSLRVDVYAPPAITAIIGDPGGCRVEWSGIPARSYTLESTVDLSNPNWSPVGSGTVANGVGSAIATGAQSLEIFRVK